MIRNHDISLFGRNKVLALAMMGILVVLTVPDHNATAAAAFATTATTATMTTSTSRGTLHHHNRISIVPPTPTTTTTTNNAATVSGLCIVHQTFALSSSSCGSQEHDTATANTKHTSTSSTTIHNRRQILHQLLLPTLTTPLITSTTITSSTIIALPIPPAQAYEPDPDPLRESLYLLSRIQEATVQQERFVRNAKTQQELKNKMKLTLMLIEKNYRIVDQIIYCSSFVPSEHLVEATEAGNIAAEELQSAIDFVKNDLSSTSTLSLQDHPLDATQKEYLVQALRMTREQLFVFLDFMPRDQVDAARERIEMENKLNVEEFDGDENAGVYNPVVLPWKNRRVP